MTTDAEEFQNPACFLVYSYLVLTLFVGKRCAETYSGCSR